MTPTTPTSLLQREHRRIEQLLAALARLARRLEGGERPLDALAEALLLLRVYADQAHHGKEEQHLFPALAAAGLAPGDGPVGVMLEEHEVGRREVQAMSDALDDLRRGDAGAAGAFARAAASYGAMLRDHIDKEDGVLFPMADELLGAEAGRLAAGYADADAAAFGPAGRAGWERRLEALAGLAAGPAPAR